MPGRLAGSWLLLEVSMTVPVLGRQFADCAETTIVIFRIVSFHTNCFLGSRGSETSAPLGRLPAKSPLARGGNKKSRRNPAGKQSMVLEYRRARFR